MPLAGPVDVALAVPLWKGGFMVSFGVLSRAAQGPCTEIKSRDILIHITKNTMDKIIPRPL
jgi:hypothetical protein